MSLSRILFPRGISLKARGERAWTIILVPLSLKPVRFGEFETMASGHGPYVTERGSGQQVFCLPGIISSLYENVFCKKNCTLAIHGKII